MVNELVQAFDCSLPSLPLWCVKLGIWYRYQTLIWVWMTINKLRCTIMIMPSWHSTCLKRVLCDGRIWCISQVPHNCLYFVKDTIWHGRMRLDVVCISFEKWWYHLISASIVLSCNIQCYEETPETFWSIGELTAYLQHNRIKTQCWLI
jgi:hypothetical protein